MSWIKKILGKREKAPLVELPDLGSAIIEIVARNLENPILSRMSGGWLIVMSPIWEPGRDGAAVRRAALWHECMLEHYYEGEAREVLTNDNFPMLIAHILSMNAYTQPEEQQLLRELRHLYVDPDAPYRPESYKWTETMGSISLIVADVARRARVGMSNRELWETIGVPNKLDDVYAIEQDFQERLGVAPVEELVSELARLGFQDTAPGK